MFFHFLDDILLKVKIIFTSNIFDLIAFFKIEFSVMIGTNDYLNIFGYLLDYKWVSCFCISVNKLKRNTLEF